ncbi:MAG: S8 family serine peptidase, partial [Thermomicrobia bacterium]|nr:S8 family serine peptidase [Thermomicrobia bacterium]
TASFAFGAPFPGTSSATPHVAGAAALFMQAFPTATPDAVLRFFGDHVKKPQGTPSGDNVSGVGLLFLDKVPQNASMRPAPSRAVGAASVAGTPVGGSAPTATRSTSVQSQPTSASSVGAAFTDDFRSPSSGLLPQGYQSGEYHVRGDAGALPALTYLKSVTTPSAEVYEVQARRVSGAPDALMGLEVRWLDKDNYLLFVISNDGSYGILARVNGSLGPLRPVGTSPAIKANASNTLRVSIVGTKFAFAVNGQTVDQFDVPDIWTRGAFGFVAGGGNRDAAEVAFANYTVKVG